MERDQSNWPKLGEKVMLQPEVLYENPRNILGTYLPVLPVDLTKTLQLGLTCSVVQTRVLVYRHSKW